MLGTLPNRELTTSTAVRLRTPYSGACPESGYPLAGSWIEVQYTPASVILELSAVAQHLPTYATEARDVETVAQMLAVDCARALGVPVTVAAYYKLRDGIELWATCQS
jgi:NADPH-dependent 7-cyano-7-deazaguanine reductase QueF